MLKNYEQIALETVVFLILRRSFWVATWSNDGWSIKADLYKIKGRINLVLGTRLSARYWYPVEVVLVKMV